MEQEWFTHWFNSDYLHLYTHRDEKEAESHVDFLINHLKLNGSEKILDVACGFGRHALVFAKRGFSVVGIDMSKEFIRQAQEHQEKEQLPHLKFIQMDMRNLNGIGTFDLAICMFTSFGYFPTKKENSAFLKEVRNCLKKQGLFFLDYLHPYEIQKDLKPYEEQTINGEKVEVRKQILDGRIIKTIQFPGRTYKESIALYTKPEIESMLQENGFQVLQVWNDYQGNPWKEEGDRQLFLSKVM